MRATIRWRVFGVLLGAVAASLLSPAGATEDAAPAAANESAVWAQKEVTFVYMGFTSKYSCDGLRDRVEHVLLELGAQKKDLKVREWGCTANFGRPDPFPGVKVKMSVLQPAAATDQPTVPAHWKTVDVRVDDLPSTADSGSCELVEEIHSKIVPLFTTRNVQYRTNCIPHQASVTGTSLKLEVLQADPEKDRAH